MNIIHQRIAGAVSSSSGATNKDVFDLLKVCPIAIATLLTTKGQQTRFPISNKTNLMAAFVATVDANE